MPPQRDLPISWNIAPTQDVLAIRLNLETQQRTLDALKWGLIPNWSKDPKIAYKTINARGRDYSHGTVISPSIQETVVSDSS
jgi:putative SOS response-associated peptidase YedK